MEKYIEVWDWIRENKLSLEVLSDYENNYRLRLRNQYGHVLIDDNGVVKNECGIGLTFDEAFEDLLKLYNNKILFNQTYDLNDEIVKYVYHFPKLEVYNE